MIKTSIIIPTCNELKLLQECIYSIKQHTTTPYEIIVVDNGSQDGTLDFCRSEEVILVSFAENQGFPVACNIGLKLATGDALLLLNNDVIVSRNWLTNMLDCLYSSENVGIVGPLTNYASGPQQVALPFTHVDDMAEQISQLYPHRWWPVKRIVGLCFMFKRELMNEIGVLDERFSPGHFEDDDYCLRARNAGYEIMIAADTFVFHHGSASFSKLGEDRVQQIIERNRQKFMSKWGVDPLKYVESG